ncbi:carbamoyl transferase [bacterium]|nr:carbamoyl transferase [bacterium]
MRVLGLNFSTDAAAALVIDGRVVAAALEERFDRVKHSGAFPRRSIQFVLDFAGLRLAEVDAVAVSWNAGAHLFHPNRRREAMFRDHREYLDIIPARLLAMTPEAVAGEATRLSIELEGRTLDATFFDHHLCHAAGAFYASGLESAAILTVDGYGEEASCRLSHGKDGAIANVGEVRFPHSIGSVYAAVTQFLGFSPNSGEGKVMALAGLGNAERYAAAFEDIVRLEDDGFAVDLSMFSYYMPGRSRVSDRFVAKFGAPRAPESPLTERDLDLAAALQTATERALTHVANILHERTGETRLCVAGGVALNAVAMGRLERDTPFAELFVLPPAHDGGGPLGAAWLASARGGVAPTLAGDAYDDRLGPDIDAASAESRLRAYGVRYQHVEDPATATAETIAGGKIVGRMSGRMEYGPRALGARSILADPRDPATKDRLNARIKYREPFRPFAPIVIESAATRFFDDARPTPYMNKVYMAKSETVDRAPAIVHDDGTVRVQTVGETHDPELYRLVSAFAEIARVPMVVNTSLNKRGEPICASLEDGLACLFTSGLDALFVGPFLVTK